MIDIAKLSDCLQKRTPVSIARLAHGFWETLAALRDMDYRPGDWRHADWDARVRKRGLLNDGFLDEMLSKFDQGLHKADALYFFPSSQAWPNSDIVAGIPRKGRHYIEKLILEYTAPINDKGSWLFKDAVINAELDIFMGALRQHDLIAVGPERIKPFESFLGSQNKYKHLIIHDREARYHRTQLLDQIHAEIEASRPGTVILFQCGSLASWLIFELHQVAQRKSVSLLDVGNMANICVPELLFSQPWAKVYQPQIFASLKQYLETNPDIQHDLRSRPSYSLWETGRTMEGESLPCPKSRDPNEFLIDKYSDQEMVRHIENKPLDIDRISQLLLVSKAQNHWANFGPLSQILQSTIKTIKDVAQGDGVLVTSSGTAATQALIGAHNALANRNLRWVVSAYGFVSSSISALSNAIVVDCNNQGMISQTELAALDQTSYDGVLFTNPFGLFEAPLEIIDWLKSIGKLVICDNAQGMFDTSTSNLKLDGEIVSFHQTKPWGSGEGGCLIAPQNVVDEARKIINFAVGSDRGAEWGFNGKISELACAAIIDRLERRAEWLTLYKMQERRIGALLTDNGFTLLRPIDSKVRNSVAALAEKPVWLHQGQTWLRKYYKPIAPTPNAVEIYSRILNVPCHPGMSRLSEDQILDHINESVLFKDNQTTSSINFG